MTSYKENPELFTFRRAVEADRPFIHKMNAETDTWGDPNKEYSDTFDEDTVFYVDGWTEGQGGVIVEENGESIGAAWLLDSTEENHGYGYVSAEYPEVAIAMAPGNTGKGLGTKLMQAVLDQAKADGKPGVSLCVVFGNDRAKHVYEKIGYVDKGVDEAEHAHVMLYTFDS
ncbi:acetyltransferase [Corynebacterium sp. HMSC08A12]|uniref:GNAT family N-acetyltransferase n=1 Tax=Corynebacterium sp. HMSC08A12 TaxID=1581134 RepID=UPI0006652CBB|nr:GNAT family N-acetyltransferase [Corynebacterium sp. HMSC08A12]OFT33672.1 acetyltransferase [Corynebacterium sp. HMSC08A12]